MSAATIEQLKARQLLRDGDAALRYRELVQGAHRGMEVDPDEALQVLANAGRTMEDLEADCQLIDQKEACRRQAAEIPQLQDEMNRNREKLRTATEARDAALREFSEIAKGVEAVNMRITARLSECNRAADRLRNDESMRDEGNWAARQEVSHQLASLSRAILDAEMASRPEQLAADAGRERHRLQRELQEATRRPQAAPRDAETIRTELAGLDEKFGARISHRDRLRERRAQLEAEQKQLEAAAIAG